MIVSFGIKQLDSLFRLEGALAVRKQSWPLVRLVSKDILNPKRMRDIIGFATSYGHWFAASQHPTTERKLT